MVVMATAAHNSVRNRRVFYIPGHDPFPPRRYRELYRAQSGGPKGVVKLKTFVSNKIRFGGIPAMLNYNQQNVGSNSSQRHSVESIQRH